MWDVDGKRVVVTIRDDADPVGQWGWRGSLMRIWSGFSDKNLSLVAAGAAFFAFLAIPSTLAALVALIGLAANPFDLQHDIAATRALLPAEAVSLLADQLKNLSSHSTESLGIGLVVSILVALWSAMTSTSSMMNALNIAYDVPERRSIVRYYGTALGLALAGFTIVVLALVVIAGLPTVLALLPLGGAGKLVATIAPWSILVALMLPTLAAFYRFAPSGAKGRCRWLSWGAVTATALWIAASALFSLYVAQFANYDRTYGSLGAVVVLQMWLYISALVVLLGAQLNADIERQRVSHDAARSAPPRDRHRARGADRSA